MKLRVRSGDSLWYYCQLFLLPLDLVLDSNPDVDPNNLSVGTEISIPGFNTFGYKITKGDTIWKLAQSYHLNPEAILILNQTVNLNRLRIGDVINIPFRITRPIVNVGLKYDDAVLNKHLCELQRFYPFIKTRTIGKSVLGKPLQEILIGTGQKKININAAFHANEWITTPILMTFLNDYLLALTNTQNLCGIVMNPFYRSVQLSVVPMVNPDGVSLVLKGPTEEVRDSVVGINNESENFTAWKANIRGVDLNNQFPAKWEIEKERKEPKGPAPRDYPGDAPLTEPEAIAMANLVKESRFDRLIALHTQGEEFYWGYEGFEPEEASIIAKEFARVSGYKEVQYIDSHAGFKDWFIQEFRKPGFTLELGKGINPLPLSQFYDIYRKTLPIFIAALYT
ncbi:M14 family metallopeptidase [Bacillus sp. T3]|uniref:M14 family metallopeptidase n=1 Tax=Bacillus sp. T3 TaxID=467262 RepID=UPI002980F61E|nr:M14 family metallopeptidase [Bacillus sp. T3]